MSNFNDTLHTMTLSEDGTYTAYSKEYDEHYHSTKDGALHESLVKHVIPAFKIKQNQDEINILDICYGLGFNTLATLYYAKKEGINSKINIYSPELDASLVTSLLDFTYPKEFDDFKEIISELCENSVYDDGIWHSKGICRSARAHVEIFLGDAREYVRRFSNGMFDVVYQDAFSPGTNPILWTQEYFTDIKECIKKDGILTTYSTALATRLALYENGFNIYINSGEDFRTSTVASLDKLDEFELVDMKHKIACNPHAKSLRD